MKFFFLAVFISLLNSASFAQNFAAYTHSYYICNDSTIAEFGTLNLPVHQNYGDSIIAVDAGFSSQMLIKSDGTLWTWGDGGTGQLGHGDYLIVSAPKRVDSVEGVVKIAAGMTASLFLRSDSTVWACGSGLLLGNSGGPFSSQRFLQILSLSGIIAIDINKDVAMALKKDGTV